MNRAHVRTAGVLAAVALVSSGCSWRGLNSLPLPGTQGTDKGSYKVRIQMPNVTTLTENSPVMLDDVTVGAVTDIELQGWHALVTVSLNPGVRLPANATAKIGQTSLLGSTHVELSAPKDEPAQGELHAGDTIPLDHAGAYPTTEQTLSALSVVLNGGGFSSLGDITHELSTALAGRGDQVRDLLGRLTTLAGGLDAQRADIETALTGMDHLTTVFAQQNQTLSDALDAVPPALQVLVQRRADITAALQALGRLSDTADQIISAGGANLVDELHELAPLLTQLADTGKHITGVLTILTAFPFPLRTYKHVVKGDYVNMMITYDISMPRLQENFLVGTPAGPPDPEPSPVSGAVTDPLRAPLQLPLPAPAPNQAGGRR